ncbi:MAG: DUF4493 domain-containing protein [Alistipes sp.]|nr:DUF4493 domain-containing protein [Alistipes sp.]
MKSVKHYASYLASAMAALSLMACSLDDLNYNNSDNGEDGQVGYLQLKSLVLNVDNENVEWGTNTPTRAGENEGQTKNTYAIPNPNNIEEDIDKYWIEVYDNIDKKWADINGAAEGVGMYYGDIPTEGVALEAGRYTVYAYKDKSKGANVKGVVADIPGTQPEGVVAYYMGYAPVTIASEKTSSVEITCKLVNVLTTVELSADLVKWFKKSGDDVMLSTTVEIAPAEVANGQTTETYSYEFPYTSNHGVADENGTITSGGPFVYFKDVAGASAENGNVLNLAMGGTFYTGLEVDIDNNQIDESKWAEVSMNRTITNVRAAQWRRISIDIDRNNEGNIQFLVTIENYVYDETIDVDVVSFYTALNMEEEVPDLDVENPLAPSIEFDGVQADENGALQVAINGTMYDEDAEAWTSFLKMKVVPQPNSTIKEVYAVFSSDNVNLLSAMAAKGFEDGRVNIYSEVAAQAVAGDASEYISVKDVEGQQGSKLVTLKAAGMSALYKYPGVHTVSVYTEDSDSRRKHTDVVITVTGGGNGNPPTIVWMQNGENVIGQRHTLTAAGLNCKVDIASSAASGFTTLKVDIISNVLTDEELKGAGLGSHIDLVNPTASQVASLQGLGFLPAGVSSLKGETETSFDITAFMAMLHSIHPESANCDFEITVGDANGETKATLMFYVEL